MTEKVEIAKEFFAEQKQVKFAYLFGSVATGTSGPLSDIDFAVLVDGRLDLFMCRLRLMDGLSRKIKTDNFDLVVLNNAQLSWRMKL